MTQIIKYLTQVVGTVINIFCAVITSKPERALAFIVGEVIHTSGTIFTGIELSAAEWYLAFTVIT